MPAAFLLMTGSREPLVLLWTAATVGFFGVLFLLFCFTRWRAFWGWLFLYVAAHISALHLIDAGPYIKLQTFRYWGAILSSYRLGFLALIFLQFVLVAWAGRGLVVTFYSYARRFFGFWRLALLALVLFFWAATFLPDHVQALVKGGFLRHSISHATKAGFVVAASLISLLNLALAIRAVPRGAMETWSSRLYVLLSRRRFALFAAGWVVIASSAIAWSVYDRVPHVPDEAAYLFHAKYLASGTLTLPAPPVPEAFPYPFAATDGTRWFLTPPVGWPLVLALGFWIAAPWLINPLLGGLGILLTHSLLWRVTSRPLASGVVFLLALSPWFLFMNASLMTHPLTLVMFLLAMLAVWHVREHGSAGWAAVAGLCVGAILHIRPLDAVLVALIAGGWWLAAGAKKLRLAPVMATAVCGLAMTALALAYNYELTGNAFQAPINMFVDAREYAGANQIGFGKNVGNFGWVGLDPLPGHGSVDVTVNANQNLYLVNFDLFGWPFGSLLPVGMLLVWGRFRRDALWWLSVVTIIAGLSLYWFSGGPDYGARYWYVLIVPFTVLTLRAAETLIVKLREVGGEAIAEARLWMLLAIASLLALAVLLPWRSIDKYKFYRGTRGDFRQLLRLHSFEKDLVFVRGRQMPDYVSASPFNPPSFEPGAAGPLFVTDLGAEKNARLVRHYSGRRVWLVEGPLAAGGRARVIAGPLPPGSIPPSKPQQ